jgi:hypothetical protein
MEHRKLFDERQFICRSWERSDSHPMRKTEMRHIMKKKLQFSGLWILIMVMALAILLTACELKAVEKEVEKEDIVADVAEIETMMHEDIDKTIETYYHRNITLTGYLYSHGGRDSISLVADENAVRKYSDDRLAIICQGADIEKSALPSESEMRGAKFVVSGYCNLIKERPDNYKNLNMQLYNCKVIDYVLPEEPIIPDYINEWKPPEESSEPEKNINEVNPDLPLQGSWRVLSSRTGRISQGSAITFTDSDVTPLGVLWGYGHNGVSWKLGSEDSDGFYSLSLDVSPGILNPKILLLKPVRGGEVEVYFTNNLYNYAFIMKKG